MTELTPQEVVDLFRLDPETGRVYWRADMGKNVQAGDEAGYESIRLSRNRWVIKAFGKKHYRSRVVFCLTHGRWPTHFLDHINRDTLDDRPDNLREATHSQNNWNRSPTQGRKLPMGVCFQKESGRYRAEITKHNKKHHLGYFDCPEEASRAYQAARAKMFGRFS